MKRDISDELKSILKVFAGNCVEKIEKVVTVQPSAEPQIKSYC